jgi:hypothetical protein
MVRRKTARSQSKPTHFLKKIVSFFIGVITIIVILLLVGFGLLIIFKPNVSNSNILLIPDKKSGGEGQIILAEIYENPPSVNIIGLKTDLKEKIIGGYGEYPLQSVLGILEIDKKSRGFIQAAYSHFLKKGIDEVHTYKAEAPFPQNKTDLLKLLLLDKDTFVTGLQVKDISDENITYRQFDSMEQWNEYLSGQLTRKIAEDCTVAVINSTDQPGLATDFSEILENSGVEVVRSTNNLWGEEQSILYSDQEETCLGVKKRVKSISPIELVENVDTEITAQYRAHVVLFIGKELATSFAE